jgi:hypothetical protein
VRLEVFIKKILGRRALPYIVDILLKIEICRPPLVHTAENSNLGSAQVHTAEIEVWEPHCVS